MPGPGRPTSRPGKAGPAILSCPTGRGTWESRASRGRAYSVGRSTSCDAQNWGALPRGGVVSTERAAYAAKVSSSRFQVSSSRKSKVRGPKSGVGSGRMLLESYRDCTKAAGEIAGTAGGDELSMPVAATG